ncbi:MAG TPA: response regulator [Geminicoccaceae bacterium]|nr:response regulator [Geminicoccaceae bacterium]
MTGSLTTTQPDAGPPPPSGVRQVYPPPWYLDLVRRRLRAATGGAEGAAPLFHTLVTTADRRVQRGRVGPREDGDGDDAALLAMALELLGRAELDGLPLPARRYVLGLELEEVRAYLRGVAREVGPEGPASVLVLEDEFLIALEVEEIVAHAGHRVCGRAARSDTAVAAAERLQPALIVADLQLADGAGTGLEAVRAIRRERGEVAVVFVTGYAERLGAELAGPALVVRKPFAAGELETALWRALLRQGHGAVAAA